MMSCAEDKRHGSLIEKRKRKKIVAIKFMLSTEIQTYRSRVKAT